MLGNARGAEVFISHRGPDVKRGLVSHLASALRTAGAATFVDDTGDGSPQSLQGGDPSWDTIVAAIRCSKVHIVVLSKGFVDSAWCLEELREMRDLHNRKDLQQRPDLFVPNFYDVSVPDHEVDESLCHICKAFLRGSSSVIGVFLTLKPKAPKA